VNFKKSRGIPFRENRTTATELEAFPLSSSFVESKRDVIIPDVLAAALQLNTPTCHFHKTKFLSSTSFRVLEKEDDFK